MVLNSTKDGAESHNHSEVTSSAMAKRHANYGSALSALDNFQQVESKFDKKNMDGREGSPAGSSNLQISTLQDDSATAELMFLK